MRNTLLLVSIIGFLVGTSIPAEAQVAVTPSLEELYSSFNDSDMNKFKSPDKVFYPETWFHYIA